MMLAAFAVIVRVIRCSRCGRLDGACPNHKAKADGREVRNALRIAARILDGGERAPNHLVARAGAVPSDCV